MLRTMSAFFVVFSLLSLIIHLNTLGRLFGMGALCLFAIDLLVAHFARSPRSLPNARRATSVTRGWRDSVRPDKLARPEKARSCPVPSKIEVQ